MILLVITIISLSSVSAFDANKKYLLSHWKFDDFTDSSGNEHVLTAYGGPTYTTSCQEGGCYYLDGIDDYFNTHLRDFTLNYYKTYSFWLKDSTPTNGAELFGYLYGYSGQIKYEFMTYNFGGETTPDLVIYFREASNNKKVVYVQDPDIYDGFFHHIVFVIHDAASTSLSSGAIEIYIDNVSQDLNIYDNDLIANFTVPNDIYIGAANDYTNGVTQFYEGYFDEMSIWNISLTPENISDIYSNGITYGSEHIFTESSITGINISGGFNDIYFVGDEINFIELIIEDPYWNASDISANITVRKPDGTIAVQSENMATQSLISKRYGTDFTLDKIGLWTVTISLSDPNLNNVTYRTNLTVHYLNLTTPFNLAEFDNSSSNINFSWISDFDIESISYYSLTIKINDTNQTTYYNEIADCTGSNCLSKTVNMASGSTDNIAKNDYSKWNVCLWEDEGGMLGSFGIVYCTPYQTFHYNIIPTVGEVNASLLNLLNGNKTYYVAAHIIDPKSEGVGGSTNYNDLISCNVTAISSDNLTILTFNLSFTDETGLCSGGFTILQNESYRFYYTVGDGWNKSNSTTYNDFIEIVGDNLVFNPNYYSDFDTQYFLRSFNITSNFETLQENINWSILPTGTVWNINISPGLNVYNGSTVTADYINVEDDYTISGSVFLPRSTYAVTRYFNYSNTYSNDLPAIQMAVPLYKFNDTVLAEKQADLFWPDLVTTDNGTHAFFNISPVNISQSQWYRIGYNGILIDWDGDNSSTLISNGTTKQWSLQRTYKVYFNLSDKTLSDFILSSNLGDWNLKSSTWGSTLLSQMTDLEVPHTSTSHLTNLEITAPGLELDNYTYSLTYYSTSSSTTTSSSGGGGGGGSSSPDPALVNLPVKWGKIQYQKELTNFVVNALPSSASKEMLIQANGTVAGTISFSPNLADHCRANVCEVGSAECSDKVIMQDGETKLFRFECDLPIEWAETLISDHIIEGVVTIKTPTTSSEHPIIVEKAAFYKIIHDIGKGTNESIIAFGVYAVATLIVLTLLYGGIRAAGG